MVNDPDSSYLDTVSNLLDLPIRPEHRDEEVLAGAGGQSVDVYWFRPLKGSQERQ
jgi:hypothetical protein